MPDAQEIAALAGAVLVPVVTAGLGALGIVLQDRRARRTVAGRRQTAFDDAGRQVAFVGEWWKAQQEVAESPERLAAARSRAQQLLGEAVALVEAVDPPTARPGPTVSMGGLLLAYPMRRTSAKVIRVLFYLSLVWLLVACLMVLGGVLDPQPMTDAGWQAAALVLSGVFTLALRFWASSAERPKPVQPA